VRYWIVGSGCAALAVAASTGQPVLMALAMLVPVIVAFRLSWPLVADAEDARGQWYEFRDDAIVYGSRRREKHLLLREANSVPIIATSETHLVLKHGSYYVFPRYFRDAAGQTYELVAANGRVHLEPRATVPESSALVPRLEL